MQNHIFRENVKYNGPIPFENSLITSVGERTQRSFNSFTGETNDMIGRDDSAGVKDHGNQTPNETTKRRKLTVPSHEISEVSSTIEPSETGSAKIEKTHQNVRIGSGKLIAFTRRKRKQSCSHHPDSLCFLFTLGSAFSNFLVYVHFSLQWM